VHRTRDHEPRCVGATDGSTDNPAMLRPRTPSHAPIIGTSPVRDPFVGTGPWHIGRAMPTGSARSLADIIGGRKSATGPARPALADHV